MIDNLKEDHYVVAIWTNGFFMSPSLAKDYVNNVVAEHQYNFDVCDRCRSTLDTTIEALRSCLSALKAEYSVTKQTT